MIGNKVPKSKSAKQAVPPNGTNLITLGPRFCNSNYNELRICNKNK